MFYINRVFSYNHNVLPIKPRLFHTSSNNTGIDFRFGLEKIDNDLLSSIQDNIIRCKLISTLESNSISNQHKIYIINKYDLLNMTIKAFDLYAGGLMHEFEQFDFD
tara:strand:- start:94 stop:411 length:318 start_codon:yes stop_codon:yes gene_type:complete